MATAQEQGAPKGAQEQNVDPKAGIAPTLDEKRQQEGQQPPAQAQPKQTQIPGTEPPDSGMPQPDDKGAIRLPFKEFMRKAEKLSRRKLREAFGTSDIDALKALKKQHDEWQKNEDERKKAELSEKERLTLERDEAIRTRDEALQRADRAKDRVRVQRTDREMRALAAHHVHHDKVDRALSLMRDEIRGMSRKRAAKLKEEWAEEWLRKLSEDSYWGKGSSSSAESAKPAAQPLNNGAPPKKGEPKPAAGGTQDLTLYKGKTARPGQANSMNPEELKEFQDMQLRQIQHQGMR